MREDNLFTIPFAEIKRLKVLKESVLEYSNRKQYGFNAQKVMKDNVSAFKAEIDHIMNELEGKRFDESIKFEIDDTKKSIQNLEAKAENLFKNHEYFMYMAQLSFYAYYSDEATYKADVKNLAHMKGLENVVMPSKDTFAAKGYKVKHIVSKSGYRAVLLLKGDEAFISFKGTTLDGSGQTFVDLKTDVDIIKVTSDAFPGRVHDGFDRAVRELMPIINDELVDHAHKNGLTIKEMQYNITGHSLGGAMAQLSSLYWTAAMGIDSQKVRVTTFGSPRLFDLDSAAEYDKNLREHTCRLAQHKFDFVHDIPLSTMGFKHAGTSVHLTPGKEDNRHSLVSYMRAIAEQGPSLVIKQEKPKSWYHVPKIMQNLDRAIFGTMSAIVKKTEKAAGYHDWSHRERHRVESKEAQLKVGHIPAGENMSVNWSERITKVETINDMASSKRPEVKVESQPKSREHLKTNEIKSRNSGMQKK